LKKKYASGHFQLIFITTEDNAKLLLDSLYDSVVLMDSATGAVIELEIADYCLNEMVLLGDDESEDLKLA